MARAPAQRGLTLIEFALALIAAVLVIGALDGVIGLALQAQTFSRGESELVYQGRFALERMVTRARATAPRVLQTPAANTTGAWFSPTMYCLNTARRQLIETNEADAACEGTVVLADNVIAFTAQPAQASAADRPVAGFTLILQAGGAQMRLETSARLGSGS